MFKKYFFGVVFVLLALAPSLQAQYNVLYSFSGAATYGIFPRDSPVLKGSTLYGMTSVGGAFGKGTIYKINKDGTGIVLLHSFAGSTADGSAPYGLLILKGSTLYGMTVLGGTSDKGTIFKINTDGAEYGVLHSFAGLADGQTPFGSLIRKGSTLYGMTAMAGAHGAGTLFKINTEGTGFAVLHAFSGNASGGAYPQGSLVFKGSMLYGMTWGGGVSHLGTVFRVKPDGSGFTLLHSFNGSTDGKWPYGSLVFKGAALYGMTSAGGTNDLGVIFKAKADGTGFTVLHHFTGGTTDGTYPRGALTAKGTNLYGMTPTGGTNDQGTIFRINVKNMAYDVIHLFSGATSDGSSPQGSLILKNSILYGTAEYGGASNNGAIFSFSLKPTI
jgi:uncharacterized repeat protein (TIGR03803 family)